MGVDVETQSVHVESEQSNTLKENGKMNQSLGFNESIKFGTHGVDEPAKGEANKVSEFNLPKDVVDEWPEPKQIHSFYIVKYRSFDDPKLKAKLDLADKEIQKKNQARSQIIKKLKAKRSDLAELFNQKKPFSEKNREIRTVIEEKRKEMEPLHDALSKFRGTSGGPRDKGSYIYSSEEELNSAIKSLQYRIQHETIKLNEEKQILREIKQLEGTREMVIANAAKRAELLGSVGEKEAIQTQVKLLGVDLDGVHKERQVVRAKMEHIDGAIDALKKEVELLEKELAAVTEKRDNAFKNLQELRRQREEGNAPFFQNRTLLIKARELAAEKDVESLKKLSEMEVEKFVTLCSSDKKFRDDYNKRILQSLDMRQLTKDGRIRNPDEKPLVLPEAPVSSVPEPTSKTNVKPSKEETVSASSSQPDAILNQKVQKEKPNKQQKATSKTVTKETSQVNELNDAEEILEMQQDLPKADQVDEAKLKEMKREEEIAKAKLAMERKKKLAEKAAAKAAIKAQKEAEKKTKEREKRARKKTGGSAATQESEESKEPRETTSEAAELEVQEEKTETPAQPVYNRKEKTVRQRVRPRGSDVPKAILKRKKATNYWLWAAPAVLVVMVLLVLGYNYLL